MSQETRSAQLKAEGNALFSQKKYALASVKYGEAIDLDGDNAVLYANRAACFLSLKRLFRYLQRPLVLFTTISNRYLDAATEAMKVCLYVFPPGASN
jgi:hypothetical protein